VEEKKKHLAVKMAETMVIGANEDLGVTQEYNRQNRSKLWDSKEAKSAYKEKVFNGKRTYRDPVTGKELHIAEKAARNKFHMKTADGKNNSTAWAAHSAEADHIVSLKELHGRVKSNAFLTDRDLKEIANQDANFRATSKHFNAQKQEKSDLVMALDRDSELNKEGKIALVKGKIGAEVHVSADIALHTAKNMGTEFAAGATEALTGALIPLTVEAVSQMCKVASGEKSLGEAAGDMAKYTVGTAVVGGARRLIVDQANFMMANSGNPLFQKIASSGQIGQITAVALIVADSVFERRDRRPGVCRGDRGEGHDDGGRYDRWGDRQRDRHVFGVGGRRSGGGRRGQSNRKGAGHGDHHRRVQWDYTGQLCG
jgi:hypothetical protein